jgi:hypothetical protein
MFGLVAVETTRAWGRIAASSDCDQPCRFGLIMRRVLPEKAHFDAGFSLDGDLRFLDAERETVTHEVGRC